ncbi:MOSC domain-containing protein [Conexibacter sp. SYSU D00693]|uniref:MOSC domain-containing protein n=1 Tax=Conexibacter sp. SYSU D00693 TaxID=2812560 RepID=UPI00196B9CD4|nr:MOSC domain-containing protein [Conexibacter sp. SYSU D00693]
MRGSFARCLASVLGVEVHTVPLPEAGEHPVAPLRTWLAERALGPVPIREPREFSWGGPWIAVHEGGACTVQFGSPAGPVYDPDGAGTAPVVEGWAISPLDVALWRHGGAGDPGRGEVVELLVAPEAEAPMTAVAEVVAEAGRGLEGDRYWAARGTFTDGRPGGALTLVDAAVLDDVGLRGAAARRNVVTRGVELNALVGREFLLGEVRCRGRRLCEPCAHLDRLSGPGLLRPLVHRGGLRADVVSTGTIRLGDEVRATGV